MAKKTLNPADAYRKAQRKKELKKNKTERAKTRDFALVKKDTSELEDEIGRLEEEVQAKGKADPRLKDLKEELEKINAKKAEYVEEHPEARRLVYKGRRKDGERAEEEKPVLASRNMFNKKGLPRHPQRSIYYDPVMNPYGVPPPGRPYMERPLLPGEIDSDVDMADDDDDIPLPPGPPPGFQEVTDDDDIPLPEGPPPGIEALDDVTSNPPLPPGLPPQSFINPALPPPPPGFPSSPMSPLGLPMPPPGFPTMYDLPPPPPGMPPPPMGFHPMMPPPHGALLPNFPPPGVPFNNPLPFPPPGFFPRKPQTAASLQDPLSTIPHQTYQAHRASQLGSPASHPSLPPKPVAATVTANATIEAAPELRDLKKEATSFVPASLKRKKAAVGAAQAPAIDAAPCLGDSGPDKTPGYNVDSGPARPDLVSVLKTQFPMPMPKPEPKPKDDYAKFVDEMGDILG